MEILSLNGTVLKPLPLKYAHDADIVVKGFTENFSSGIVFPFTPAFENVEDFSTNNYNSLILTDKFVTSDLFELSAKAPEYPLYLPTTLTTHDGDFWTLNNLSHPVSSTVTVQSVAEDKLNQSHYFEVILLDSLDCLVRSYNNGVIKYLTHSKSAVEPSELFTFEVSPDIQNELTGLASRLASTQDLSAAGSSTKLDFTAQTYHGDVTRTFGYLYDGYGQLILLVKGLSANNVISSSSNTLSTASLTGWGTRAIITSGGYIAGSTPLPTTYASDFDNTQDGWAASQGTRTFSTAYGGERHMMFTPNGVDTAHYIRLNNKLTVGKRYRVNAQIYIPTPTAYQKITRVIIQDGSSNSHPIWDFKGTAGHSEDGIGHAPGEYNTWVDVNFTYTATKSKDIVFSALGPGWGFAGSDSSKFHLRDVTITLDDTETEYIRLHKSSYFYSQLFAEPPHGCPPDYYSYKFAPEDRPFETPAYLTSNDSVTSRVLLLGALDSEVPMRAFSDEDILHIQPRVIVDGLYKIPSRWHSYKDDIQFTKLNVDPDTSVNNIKNNYIVASTHNDILTSGVLTNFIPLKNQLTPHNKLARGNPYDEDTEVTFRDYQKINSGANQEHGNEDLVLTYTAGVKEYIFEPDKLTYFNYPYVTSPYEIMNIKHSSLIHSGSIAGDSPVTSDKMFKKMEKGHAYKFKDEQNGTWLCSWLSANGDPNKPPIWVDRYYNPYTSTREDALTATNDGRFYVDKFTSTLNILNASVEEYFDKYSDLTFEPGALYAYHHIGRNYINSLLEFENPYKLVKNVSYKDHRHYNKTPEYINKEPVYHFNGLNYCYTNEIDNSGSFTMTFALSCADWTTPFGHEILGNYVNEGIGFYNDMAVTPYITIPDGNSIRIYNTDFKLLHTIVDISPKYILRKGSTDNIYVIDTDNFLYEYDVNWILQNKTDLNVIDVGASNTALLDDKTFFVDSIIDADIDKTNIYLNTYAALNSAQKYLTFNYNAENKFYTAHTYYAESSASRIDVSKHGVYIPEAIGHGANHFTSDNKGNTWNSLNPTGIYRTDIEDITTSNVISSFNTSVAQISASTPADNVEGVDCDEDNNIWLLHSSNKVTKMDSDRKVLFTKTLTTTPATASMSRYIDFVREFVDGKLQRYAIIVNQSNEGSNVIKVNFDGTVRDTIDLYDHNTSTAKLSSFEETTGTHSSWKSITGYSYLRKWIIDKHPGITCRFSVQNLYENEVIKNTFKEFSLKHPTGNMLPGWHTFCFKFDAEHGDFDLYVDGVKSSSVIMKDIRARYSFINMFKQPLSIGVAPHFSGQMLPDMLQQKKHYYCSKMRVKDVHVYGKALKDQQIKFLSDLKLNIRPLRWNIPCGQRNFIDTVERFFKFSLPGHPSNYVNLVIENLQTTDVDIIAEIEREIKSVFDKVAPSHVELNKIEFRQNESL